MSHEKAASIIVEGKDTHIDPDSVDAFGRLNDEFRAMAARLAAADPDMTKNKRQLDRLWGTDG